MKISSKYCKWEARLYSWLNDILLRSHVKFRSKYYKREARLESWLKGCNDQFFLFNWNHGSLARKQDSCFTFFVTEHFFCCENRQHGECVRMDCNKSFRAFAIFLYKLNVCLNNLNLYKVIELHSYSLLCFTNFSSFLCDTSLIKREREWEREREICCITIWNLANLA